MCVVLRRGGADRVGAGSGRSRALSEPIYGIEFRCDAFALPAAEPAGLSTGNNCLSENVSFLALITFMFTVLNSSSEVSMMYIVLSLVSYRVATYLLPMYYILVMIHGTYFLFR